MRTVIMGLVLIASFQMGSAMHAGTVSATSSVPPAAQALASRLGIYSNPIIGNQPNGAGGPWTVWFPRVIKPAWVGPGNVPRHFLPMSGRALFAGPKGAAGEFHYYDDALIRKGFGADPYHGKPLTRARATRIAFAWLRTAGAPIPSGGMDVQIRRGATILDGTGLCCFTSLAVISWGRKQRDRWGDVLSAAAMIYIADAGTVVQVDVGSFDNPNGNDLSRPCSSRRDTNGVPVGRWCFDYAAAVRSMIVADIGGHGPWRADPQQLRYLPCHLGFGDTDHYKLVTLNASAAVFTQSCRKTTYRSTLVPAFPGLAGSIWEKMTVERL